MCHAYVIRKEVYVCAAVLGGMYIIWQIHSHDTIAQLKAAHSMHNDVDHSE